MSVDREFWKSVGQDHVLEHFDVLDESKKESFARELNDAKSRFNSLRDLTQDSESKLASISPFPPKKVVSLLDLSSDEIKVYREKGISMLKEGQVAALVMAGGQGTRLGSSAPKGCYDIGLPSGKTLFRLQAERLARLQVISKSTKLITWYVMTSPATDQETREYFESNSFFGLKSENVFFFQQGLEICLDIANGNLMIESTGKLCRSPNGNGGIYRGLKDSGALDHMHSRGIEYVFTYAVDNVLVKVCDPLFVGFCAANSVDFGNKTLSKSHAHEKVGVLALKDGVPGVVEYSELSEELATLCDDSGKLVYAEANIAIHCFSLKFLDKVANSDLPYHLARKKISTLSSDGHSIMTPESINGFKFEMFIFDSLALSSNSWAFSVARAGEFSPRTHTYWNFANSKSS